jgi:hypothetical protein
VRDLKKSARSFLKTRLFLSADFTVVVPNEDFRRFMPTIPVPPHNDPAALEEPARLADNPGADDWWLFYCIWKKTNEFPPRPRDQRLKSFDFQEDLLEEDLDLKEKKRKTLRLQVCRAFEGSAWSITVRWSPPDADKFNEPAKAPVKVIATEETFMKDAADVLGQSGWKPRSGYQLNEPNPFLFSIEEKVQVLFDLIAVAESPGQGLLLITGETNCSKSQIATGMAWRFLERSLADAVKRRRRPHLITYEDPVEEVFQPRPGVPWNPPLDEKKRVIDYTSRQARLDADSLEDALNDALRQTPAVFYAGEIRDEQDFRSSLKFGGKGHLIIATAHAGSLIEAMGTILSSVNAKDPGTRAIHVPKILAVVHLSPLECAVKIDSQPQPHESKPVIPSLYRRMSQGIQSLNADGLTALLPYFPAGNQPDQNQFGSLGRQYFVTQLCAKPPNTEAEKNGRWADVWADARKCHGGHAGSEKVKEIPNRSLIDRALTEDLHGG